MMCLRMKEAFPVDATSVRTKQSPVDTITLGLLLGDSWQQHKLQSPIRQVHLYIYQRTNIFPGDISFPERICATGRIICSQSLYLTIGKNRVNLF